jgi:hypothetical protein
MYRDGVKSSGSGLHSWGLKRGGAGEEGRRKRLYKLRKWEMFWDSTTLHCIVWGAYYMFLLKSGPRSSCGVAVLWIWRVNSKGSLHVTFTGRLLNKTIEGCSGVSTR